MHFLQEGGPIFMYSLLIMFFCGIAIFIYGLTKPEKRNKAKELLSSLGLFALVFGFLGQILGLITAFDAISIVDNISPGILADGLKISFLTSGFGALVFLVCRFGILTYIFIKK